MDLRLVVDDQDVRLGHTARDPQIDQRARRAVASGVGARADGLDAATHGFHEAAGDSQAKAGAGSDPVTAASAIEAVEDVG